MAHHISSAWASYPAAAAAGAFATGIALASLGSLRLHDWLLLLTTAALLVSALCCFYAVRRKLGRIRVLCLSLAGLATTVGGGGLRYVTYYALPADHFLPSAIASSQVVSVNGRIIEDPVIQRGVLRLTVELPGPGPAVHLLVTARSPLGAWMEPSWENSSHPGADVSIQRCDVVKLRGRVEPLARPRNPGEFDYGRYLFHQRTYARMFPAKNGIHRVGRRRSGWSCSLEDVRAIVRHRLSLFVPRSSSRAVLQALVLGDRRLLDRGLRDRLARVGLLHLLAVSGLHVLIVGMSFYRLLGPSLRRLALGWRAAEVIRTAGTTLLLLGYMVITGCPPSVVRAVVMTVLMLGSTSLQRPSRPLNTLGMAVLVLLVANPGHLFSAGFQLSAAAVAAILTITPQLTRWIPPPASPLGRHVHSATAVTLAATIGTLPVSLYHFGQAGLAGLVLNLPAIPLTAGVLSSGVAMLTLGEAVPGLGEPLGATADLFARLLLRVAEIGDRYMAWSLLRWTLSEPAHVLTLTLLAAAVSVWHRERQRWTFLLLAVTVLTAHLGRSLAAGRYRPVLDVIVLDVGHGDATLVRLPDGNGLLIDAGPRSPFTDTGSRVVLPQLAFQGIQRLSVVVITHPDSDHIGGLPAILRQVPVGRVVRSGVQHESNLFAETNLLLDSLGIRQQIARRGDTLSFAGDVRGYVLHPPEALGSRGSNENSLVILLRFGEARILLTGDAPSHAELAIAQGFGALVESDILKVSHHGSRTSSAGAFLLHVSRGETAGGGDEQRREPRHRPYAVISTAARNRFGLPDEDVLRRLRRTGFHLLSTAEDGAAWFRSDGRGIERVVWRSP